MITSIALMYCICGVLFHGLIKKKYKITKKSIPMWLVNVQLIFGWLPIIIYSAIGSDSPHQKLQKELNKSIKEAGIIQPLYGVEMPGKDEYAKMQARWMQQNSNR